MADRTALGFMGYLLGGVTAVVMLIGGVVVNLNVSEDGYATPRSISMSAQTR